MSSADLIQGATCAALPLCVCVCTDSLAGVLIDSPHCRPCDSSSVGADGCVASSASSGCSSSSWGSSRMAAWLTGGGRSLSSHPVTLLIVTV